MSIHTPTHPPHSHRPTNIRSPYQAARTPILGPPPHPPLQFWRASKMDDEAVNLVSARRHQDSLAGDRNQFLASVYASAPGRLVIPSAIITSHAAAAAGGEGSKSLPGTAVGRVASPSLIGKDNRQTAGMIQSRCCAAAAGVPQAVFSSLAGHGGGSIGQQKQQHAQLPPSAARGVGLGRSSSGRSDMRTSNRSLQVCS